MSADTIVPNGDKASIIPLTTSFNEPAFLLGVAEENAFTLENGFWSQLSGKQKETAKLPWGPQNPQALNRYAYVMNNPLKYTDLTGHEYLENGDEEMGYEFLHRDSNGRRVFKIWWHEFEATITETELTTPTLDDFKDAVDARSSALARVPIAKVVQAGAVIAFVGSGLVAMGSCPSGVGLAVCIGSGITLVGSGMAVIGTDILLGMDRQTIHDSEIDGGELMLDFKNLGIPIYKRR